MKMACISSITGLLCYTQKTFSSNLGTLLLLMFLMTQVNHCQGRAVKNLYDICPNRRHSKEHDNSLQHIPELSKLLRKKVQQLQDDYHSSGRISHGDRHLLERSNFENLPEIRSYEEEEEFFFETYHAVVTFVHFLELSQNDEYDSFGKGDQSFFEEFKDIVQGHYDHVYNMETLLCELSVVMHKKGTWKTFQQQDKVGEEVIEAASDIDTRQLQIYRDYMVLERAALYLNHVRNHVLKFLDKS